MRGRESGFRMRSPGPGRGGMRRGSMPRGPGEEPRGPPDRPRLERTDSERPVVLDDSDHAGGMRMSRE